LCLVDAGDEKLVGNTFTTNATKPSLQHVANLEK